MEDINDTNTTTPASREFIATQIISVNVEGSEPSDKPLPDRSYVTADFSITKASCVLLFVKFLICNLHLRIRYFVHKSTLFFIRNM